MPKIILEGKEYTFVSYATIGRSSKCAVCIDDIKLSRVHCEIIQDEKDFILVDLHSQNGVKLNDHFVTEAILKNEDKVTLGRTAFTFLRINND